MGWAAKPAKLVLSEKNLTIFMRGARVP